MAGGGITAQHDQYAYWRSRWDQNRTGYEGEFAVKAAGQRYLPPLALQESPEYEAYKARASWYNAIAGTVNGMTGLVFAKPPTVSAEGLEEFTDDVTTGGASLSEYATTMVRETLLQGRVFTLVDWPRESTAGMTVAEAETSGLRPRWLRYVTENVINWIVDDDEPTRLLRCVVRERRRMSTTVDEWDSTREWWYRALFLDESGQYAQQLYNEAGAPVGDPVEILVQGSRIDFIPLYLCSPEDVGWDVSKPPAQDVSDLNMTHYRTDADLAHALHYGALQQPYVTGLKESELPKTFGPTRVWGFENESATVGMLEFRGATTDALGNKLRHLEMQMAAVGARMLSPEDTPNETATAASLRKLGETSTIRNVALSVSDTLEDALRFTAEWMGQPDADVAFELNTDYHVGEVDAQLIQQMAAMQGMGQVSYETLWTVLQRGDLADPQRTAEEERALVETGQ